MPGWLSLIGKVLSGAVEGFVGGHEGDEDVLGVSGCGIEGDGSWLIFNGYVSSGY